MSDRPFSNRSTRDLISIFDNGSCGLHVMELLTKELRFRKRNSARDLLGEVERALADTLKKSNANDLHYGKPSGNYSLEFVNQKSKTQTFAPVPTQWDKYQRSVIESDSEDLLVVEAGPGSGKTAVACARVAALIEEHGLTASKILLVSFTRTAVKELRDRIKAHSRDPDAVEGLKIVTLDSFTFEIVRGLGDQQGDSLLAGYDKNIQSFLDLLNAEDEELLDHLGELEHVVMDEGQDLVAIRAELALGIINALHEECGVTIFADSAQAIYGFTDDQVNGVMPPSRTVVERIKDGETGEFSRILLENNHRTRDMILRKLVSTGRKKLVDLRRSSPESWLEMRSMIESNCHGQVSSDEMQDLKGRSDTLVLYRSRAEVLMASSLLWGNGVPHKVRMSGIPARVHPWIGRLFGGGTDDHLDKEGLRKLWSDRIGTSPGFDESFWELLLAHAGDRSGRILMIRLREVLVRDRPPVDFLVDEAELDGPILGTIHASKGREADRVHLMLPPEDYLTARRPSPSPPEIAEEERVLFVGATRARQTLFCGQGCRLGARRLESGRLHRPIRNKKDRRQIEVGLADDIRLSSLAEKTRAQDEVETVQNWLWENKFAHLTLEARYDINREESILWHCEGGKEMEICALSRWFSRDLWSVGREVAAATNRTRCKPLPTIFNIRMVGTSTVVIPEADRGSLHVPWRHSGFLLAPVITGFPLVIFKAY